MSLRDFFPGGASARDRADRLRGRLEQEGDRLEDLQRREADLRERSVSATVAGDEDEADDLRERRLRLRLEIEDREAAVERLEEELADVLPAALAEEHRAAVERHHSARARAETAAADLLDAVEALIAGPAARLAAAYRAFIAAARRAGELERELAEEHDAETDVTTPSRVDRRFQDANRDAWAALEKLREFNSRRGR